MAERENSKTKQLIEETFIDLLEKEPLSKIGVKELTQAAGINRNTFYYHYRNIPDLIESIIKRFIEETIATHPPTYNSFEDCLLAGVEMVQANKQSIYHIYNSANRSVFERYLWKICDYAVTSYVDSIPPVIRRPSPRERELLIGMLKYECFGFIMDWIMHGMYDGVSEGIRLLSSFIRNQQSYLYTHPDSTI